MDLVGNDEHVIGHADIDEAAQLGDVPNAPDGVVRAAEDEHLGLRARGLLGEVVEIHLVATTDYLERVLDELALSGLDGHLERVVYGRLDDDGVAGLGELANGAEDGGDDSGRGDDPGGVGAPAVVPNLPVDAGGGEAVGGASVAEGARIDELMKGSPDLGRVVDLHIGD